MGFAGHSRFGLSRESLLKTSLLMTLQIPTCASHVACFAVISCKSVASPIAKTTSSQILYQTFTHSPYIKSHKNSGKWLNRITIKFHMKLKPTKKHSCKSLFYNLPIWLFRDKTLKQNLNLKGELGNRGKTYSHLHLKSVKHLDHIHLYSKTLVHNK